MPRLDAPRQAIMYIPEGRSDELQHIAVRATKLCQGYLPRVTGASAATITPIWGDEWFGVEWVHDSVWFMEAGIRPFTMRSLAGKTIPMWVNDRDGEIRRKNPRAQTRTRQDSGETQVLIFRRAANLGQRKVVTRFEGGTPVRREVPASYPGAPGRIAVNRSQGIMRAGDVDPNARNRGQIARGNVGVRWRHPGLDAGKYIAHGVTAAAEEFGLPVEQIEYLPANTMYEDAPYRVRLLRV